MTEQDLCFNDSSEHQLTDLQTGFHSLETINLSTQCSNRIGNANFLLSIIKCSYSKIFYNFFAGNKYSMQLCQLRMILAGDSNWSPVSLNSIIGPVI